MTDRRIRGADFARAFACLAVFLHHIGLAVAGLAFQPLVQSGVALTEHGKHGVSIFFVLSGFLLSLPLWQACDQHRQFVLGRYALRRLSRLAPATWLCLIVSYGVDRVLQIEGPGHGLLRLTAGMFFLSDWNWLTVFPVNANGPLWSLSFEATSYCLMPIAFVGLRLAFPMTMRGWTGRYLWVVVLILALTAHGIVVATVAKPLGNVADDHLSWLAKSWWPRYNPLALFVLFAIGTLAAGIQTQIAASRSLGDHVHGAALLVGGVLFANASQSLLWGQALESPPFAFPALPLAVGLYLILCQSIPRNPLLDNQAVAFFAKISFGFYIWHAVVILLLSMALKTQNVPPLPMIILLTTGTALIAGTMATISYSYFEAPIMAWAQRIEQSGPRHQSGSAHPSDRPGPAR